ncbi:MAG: F0F1 ATP synthase subunit alpha, partial [Gammaproteobacteria bacterium]
MRRAEDADGGPLSAQARWLARYDPALRIGERGSVVSVGDGIARITGLPSAAMDDVLNFEDGSRGVVFDLNERRIGAVLLRVTDALTAGTAVHLSGQRLSVPVGDELLGRVIDPLGRTLDDGPVLNAGVRQSLESPAPPIVARDFVHSPFYTGIKIIDTLIPIGKGQRQLLLGDDGLGRSSLVLDAVVNQRD